VDRSRGSDNKKYRGHERECKNCGEKFSTSAYQKVYCTPKCQHQSHVRYNKELNQRETTKLKKKVYVQNNIEKVRASARRGIQKIKILIIQNYGGRCVCCGETEIDFLTIDHVNGLKGQSKKKERGRQFYYRLIREGFPQDLYQCLCMNCNWGRRFTGVCPHARNNG